MLDDEIRQGIARIDAAFQEVLADDKLRSELIAGYALGHSLAIASLMLLLIDRGVVSAAELAARLLASGEVAEAQPGGKTAKQALAHLAYIISPMGKREN